MDQMEDKHEEAACALDGDCDTEPSVSEVIKVCSSEHGLCEDVPIHLAPLHDESCQL